jgi:6-phosphogluconate dehydrogenase
MVHNGIEYGDMQLIAEAYDILKHVGGLNNQQLHDVFAEWNRGELASFLIEITEKVINFPDPDGSGKPLVELILDKVGMKGTGTWTIEGALDMQVPVPTMAAAVDGREISMQKEQRLAAEKVLPGPDAPKWTGDVKALVEDVKHALFCSKICSYAQGMAMLAAANLPKPDTNKGQELGGGKFGHGYGINLANIAEIWRAGCIIRADFLDDITKEYRANPNLANLLLADKFRDMIVKNQGAWRRVVALGVAQGIATPAFSASLAYYDAYRRGRLPGNLIQAQRDYFGGHTYVRTDKPGVWHMEWQPGGRQVLQEEGKARTK